MEVKELRDFINDPDIKDDDDVLCVEFQGKGYMDFEIERLVKRDGVVFLCLKRVPEDKTSPLLHEDIEKHRRKMIDDAPRGKLLNPPMEIEVAKVESENSMIVEYYDPNTYELVLTAWCISD